LDEATKKLYNDNKYNYEKSMNIITKGAQGAFEASKTSRKKVFNGNETGNQEFWGVLSAGASQALSK
jgi:hypothetical protein